MSESARPFYLPLLGLVLGAILMQVPRAADAGKLVLYFGAQSFMSIFTGWMMATSVTAASGTEVNGHVLDKNLTGCPVGFALTAVQQAVSFLMFGLYCLGAYFTPYRYTPKSLNSGFEIVCVVVFGCVFALNIALNNFSLAYISIGTNLILRSCLPLTTFLSQQALAVFNLYPFRACRCCEVTLMMVGVLCACVALVAQAMASAQSGHANETGGQILGILTCLVSVMCGSLNLALAGVLGESKLNEFDMVAYMAIPATLLLLPIVCFVQKPVPGQWAVVFERDAMTDLEILVGVWHTNKTTIGWLVLSGVFAFAYNVVQFSIVQSLSPSATAFGGNFNKMALILMTLLLPCMQTHKNPGSPCIQVIWVTVLCNIAAFGYYSYLQIQSKNEETEPEHTPKLLDTEEGGEMEAAVVYDSPEPEPETTPQSSLSEKTPIYY